MFTFGEKVVDPNGRQGTVVWHVKSRVAVTYGEDCGHGLPDKHYPTCTNHAHGLDRKVWKEGQLNAS